MHGLQMPPPTLQRAGLLIYDKPADAKLTEPMQPLSSREGNQFFSRISARGFDDACLSPACPEPVLFAATHGLDPLLGKRGLLGVDLHPNIMMGYLGRVPMGATDMPGR